MEVAITSEHAVNIDSLPPIHRDPFDRLLLAQARTEGVTLLTTDERLASYPGPIRQV
jgi:PIN domain nuclease of toxin-antitoxin system